MEYASLTAMLIATILVLVVMLLPLFVLKKGKKRQTHEKEHDSDTKVQDTAAE